MVCQNNLDCKADSTWKYLFYKSLFCDSSVILNLRIIKTQYDTVDSVDFESTQYLFRTYLRDTALPAIPTHYRSVDVCDSVIRRLSIRIIRPQVLADTTVQAFGRYAIGTDTLVRDTVYIQRIG